MEGRMKMQFGRTPFTENAIQYWEAFLKTLCNGDGVSGGHRGQRQTFVAQPLDVP